MAAKNIREEIAMANRAADTFIRLYYTSIDSPQRADNIVKLYRPNSIFTWNGTNIPGAKVGAFFATLPPSKHDVTIFDCHPIPGSTPPVPDPTSPALIPPSLLITVSGNVTYGPTPPTSHSRGQGQENCTTRIFAHTFVLLLDKTRPPLAPGVVNGATGTPVTIPPTYYIGAETMRFVG